jgi:hypothetical protein
MSKKIVFTAHSLTAMAERDVLPEWVEKCVRTPQWIEPDPSDPETIRHFCMIGERGRYLRVVMVETSDNIRIVTAFFDRGARPK